VARARSYTDTALAPRLANWDNGAVHGISVHRLPNGTYALFYMGAEQPGLKAHLALDVKVILIPPCIFY
jgi:hypothetical protein